LATADWDTVIPWLSPYVVEQIEATWALGIKGERAARFRELVASRKRHAYREHAYATGVVQSL
ncbi:MAG TPA: hypothetical protein VFT29_10615, partial [Gemmatimonadaceae bacterium]|nr:hypothetical protein [Gemmatimonadaceae bacterium]